MKTLALFVAASFVHFVAHAKADAVYLDTDKPIQLHDGSEIGVLRKGEGEHWLYLKSAGSADKLCLWKSFWGSFEIIVDKESNAIAFQDLQRFGILSPVIVVHYWADGAQFVYQTPGNYSLDSFEFSYQLKSFISGKLQIGLGIHEFDENSSRPNFKEVSTFSVSPKIKEVIVPQFYAESDSLFIEKPFPIK